VCRLQLAAQPGGVPLSIRHCPQQRVRHLLPGRPGREHRPPQLLPLILQMLSTSHRTLIRRQSVRYGSSFIAGQKRDTETFVFRGGEGYEEGRPGFGTPLDSLAPMVGSW
jgi:hypothetical protein